MNILVIENDASVMKKELAIVRRCAPDSRVQGFLSAEAALDYMRDEQVDTVFLDVGMSEANGIEIARNMRQLNAELNMIIVSAYDFYYPEALSLRASGYLKKPLREEAVLEELRNLRYPVRANKQYKGLFIRAFGNFEVFFDGQPVLFRYQKTKELLAYLVNRRGAVVARDELITILWGGATDKTNYFKQVQKDLNDTLVSYGLEHILVKQRGALGILMDEITCDYYDYLNGYPRGVSAYRGEYMRQYDWAESTWVNLEGKDKLWLL